MIFMHWLHSHANTRSTTYQTAEEEEEEVEERSTHS
jgi:hypothetical protein